MARIRLVVVVTLLDGFDVSCILVPFIYFYIELLPLDFLVTFNFSHQSFRAEISDLIVLSQVKLSSGY